MTERYATHIIRCFDGKTGCGKTGHLRMASTTKDVTCRNCLKYLEKTKRS